MNKQLDIDTAAIIAAVESELAANWYAHAAAERRALGAVLAMPDDAPGWGDLAIALAVWAVFPAALVLGMWVAGIGG